LLLCDAATWQPTHELDLGAGIGAFAVSPAPRRVASIVGGDVVVHEVRVAK
jgi:hypothetical protein